MSRGSKAAPNRVDPSTILHFLDDEPKNCSLTSFATVYHITFINQLVVLTGQRSKVWLDVEFLQQHSSRKVDGEVTPGLLWEEDIGPGC